MTDGSIRFGPLCRRSAAGNSAFRRNAQMVFQDPHEMLNRASRRGDRRPLKIHRWPAVRDTERVKQG